MSRRAAAMMVVAAVGAGMATGVGAQGGGATARPGVLDLWAAGKTAFGVFVPDENPAPRGPNRGPAVYTAAGAAKLQANPLLDFVFLNLEGAYDRNAVMAVSEGLGKRGTPGRKTLLVRIPSLADAGPQVTGQRIKEILAMGADGVTIPHVENLDHGRQVVSLFSDARADVWSAANPGGTVIAMMMLEDPRAMEQAAQIADIGGYSVLACGIGSLTQALKGDRKAAEAGNQALLAETKRTKLVNMLTAGAGDVAQRVKEGFLGLLAMGSDTDAVIRAGRAAAGR
ncbi:MAG: aldolase/citrate lyase family protein [Vicinamibacterales bacterium]